MLEDITYYTVTGDWRHIVDDGVDPNLEPDQGLPEGKVTFEPLSPRVVTIDVEGVPTAFTLSNITGKIEQGVLKDNGGNVGVKLTGELGGATVRYRAIVDLYYNQKKIKYPMVEFDLTEDAIMTAYIATKPGAPAELVDPRIEGYLTKMKQYIGQILDAGNAGPPSWDTLLNKPDSFPAQSHRHKVQDLDTTNEATAEAFLKGDGSWSKPDSISYESMTKPEAEAGTSKEPRLVSAEILDGAIKSKAPVVTWSSLTGKPTSYTPSSHTHEITSVTNLQAALDTKANTSHTHTVASIGGLQTVLDGKAEANHTHTIANVSGLQAALDTKASTSHTHSVANISGLQTALDGKAATTHTHAIADITNLQATLAAKEKKSWVGTQSEYDALQTKEADVTYNIVEA